jgi:hypothetical protein
MENEIEKNYSDEFPKDLPLREENPGFAPEELIVCAKCQRTNAPTRLKCFYCGAELEIGETQSKFLKPNLRKLEIWEKGFNLIYLPATEIFGEEKLSEIAKLLKSETDALRKLFDAKKPLPLKRAETEKEAEITQKRLSEFGIETRIIGDESLATQKPPRRLHGVEFSEDELILILFNGDEIVKMPKEDLMLIVTGAVFQKKVKAVEQRSKKGENKILEASEVASDEILFDVYNRQTASGFRILEKGFDFSCLAGEKGILAVENMKKLVRKLKANAPEAKIVDDYLQIREILGNVWEVEHKTDSLGLTRERFGKFNLGNITTADNLSQFTKYSRLQWQLL